MSAGAPVLDAKLNLSEHAAGRAVWPDAAKGIAIILVVFGHVLGGLMAGQLIPAASFGAWVYEWLYLFHIPVFFFVSGWLVEFRGTKRGSLSLKNIASTLLYPYFLWGAVTWAVHRVGDQMGMTNHHVGQWIPWDLYHPSYVGPWYLLVLALFHVLYWLLHASQRRTQWCMLIALALFAELAWFQNVNIESLRYLCGLNLVFYAFGALLSAEGLFQVVDVGRADLILGGLALLALMGGVTWVNPRVSLWATLPLGLLGVSGVLGLSLGVCGLRHMNWLAYVGRCSLPIYLLHGMILPVIRWFLSKRLDIGDETVLAVAGTACGVLLPLAVAILVKRWRVGWVFRYGSAQTSRL